jgi:hypothetical protein
MSDSQTQDNETILRLRMVFTSCWKCGIVYGLPTHYIESRKSDGRKFWCPNGHASWYPSEDEQETSPDAMKALKHENLKLRHELDQAEATTRDTLAMLNIKTPDATPAAEPNNQQLVNAADNLLSACEAMRQGLDVHKAILPGITQGKDGRYRCPHCEYTSKGEGWVRGHMFREHRDKVQQHNREAA